MVPSAFVASGATAVGLATLGPDAAVLDVWYPRPVLTGPQGGATVEAAPGTVRLGDPATGDAASRGAGSHDPGFDELGAMVDAATGRDEVRGVDVVAVRTTLARLADAPVDAYDAWLRLHLLSHRLVAPHGANLEGLFGLLANVAWTSAGPVPLDGLDRARLAARAAGRSPLVVHGVDKFPRMTDYVAPSGVRIADASRVRLGAHLAEGTTVMHEGFVNFNAGTLGPSMVEGRISAGVVVGPGSDLGGGSSTMGTLSGGGTEIVSVGARCLLGANAGIGISLGDDCVVEAGLYLTAGTRIRLPDGTVAKGRDLSGHPNLLFWRNSLTGAVEARSRDGRQVELNAELHAN